MEKKKSLDCTNRFKKNSKNTEVTLLKNQQKIIHAKYKQTSISLSGLKLINFSSTSWKLLTWLRDVRKVGQSLT